jgi:hypothetical protein
MAMNFWINLPTKDFIKALKTVKPRLRSTAKKSGTLDISFINEAAVFCVGGAMTRISATGHWAGLVETPFLTLLSFIQVPPTGDTVKLEFDGEKFRIGSFRCKASWQNVSDQFAEIKNEIHLNELDKKAELKKHYCPSCGTKTGIPQQDTPTDLFEGLNTEVRPITRYQCSSCTLGWMEEIPLR